MFGTLNINILLGSPSFDKSAHRIYISQFMKVLGAH